jgi:hypothetical protein
MRTELVHSCDGSFDPRVNDPTGGHSPLLHFGCALLTSSRDQQVQTVSLNGGVTIYFRYIITSPAPPPAPPAPPSLPARPPSPPHSPLSVAEVLNRRFRNGMPTNDLEAAGVLIHQFDAMGASLRYRSHRHRLRFMPGRTRPALLATGTRM